MSWFKNRVKITICQFPVISVLTEFVFMNRTWKLDAICSKVNFNDWFEYVFCYSNFQSMLKLQDVLHCHNTQSCGNSYIYICFYSNDNMFFSKRDQRSYPCLKRVICSGAAASPGKRWGSHSVVGAQQGLPTWHHPHWLWRRADHRVPHEEPHVLHPDHEETTGTRDQLAGSKPKWLLELVSALAWFIFHSICVCNG